MAIHDLLSLIEGNRFLGMILCLAYNSHLNLHLHCIFTCLRVPVYLKAFLHKALTSSRYLHQEFYTELHTSTP